MGINKNLRGRLSQSRRRRAKVRSSAQRKPEGLSSYTDFQKQFRNLPMLRLKRDLDGRTRYRYRNVGAEFDNVVFRMNSYKKRS